MSTTVPAAASPTSSPRFVSPLLWGIASLFPLLILTLIYRRYCMTFIVHSDFCNFLLQADAIWHGNPLLRHWYLTTVSYYTTDVLYFTLGMGIRGFNPILMHEVPPVVFVLIVALCLRLAAFPFRANRLGWIAAAAMTFALIGLPCLTLATSLLTGTLHTGMMLPVLAAFVALDIPDTSDKAMSPLRLASFFVALTMATLADTMALYIVVAPLLLVLVAEIRTPKDAARRRDSLWIAGATLAVAPTAKIILHGIAMAGGFKMPDMYSSHAAFVPINALATNIGNSIETLQMMYGADFWGLPVDGVKGRALHLTGLIVVLYALALGLQASGRFLSPHKSEADSKPHLEIDRLSMVLTLGMVLNLLTYTISNLQDHLYTSRYLTPFVIMGAILVGRWLHAASSHRRAIMVMTALYGLVSLPWFYLQLRQPRLSFDTSAARLGYWLRAHGMEDAYGEYWCSSAVTVLSHKAALVRPLLESDGKMAPYLCSVDERWYKTPVHCLVMGPQNFYNVCPQAATMDFGPPDRSYGFEGYTIYWYKKDLTPLLGKSPNAVP